MSAITVYITGASSGLGRALALHYAKMGARLALVARRETELNEVASKCLQSGAAEVLIIVADLSLPEESQQSVRTTQEKLGVPDIFIANAGISKNHSPQTLKWEEFKKIYDTNVYGAVAGILEVLPAMLKKNSGHIAGISSIAGFRGLPTSACYSSSKAALTAFLESLRQDLKRSKSGVAVSVVSPGFISTPLVNKNKHPMPLIMSPEKAARIIAWGIEKHTPHIAFPKTMVFLAWIAKMLPSRPYDAIMTQLPWKR